MNHMDIRSMAQERRQLAGRLQFHDANLWLGQPKGFPLATELPVAQLAGTLARYQLCGGLVSHWRAAAVSAQDGNAALAEIEPQLPPHCYTVMAGLPLYPEDSGLLPGRSALPASVRGVRIFPVTHRFDLAPYCVGSLCDWLAARHLPLFIWHTELDWRALWELARAFPALPIVVETQTQKILYHTRRLFPLMRDCPNVRIEISNFVGAGFLEFAVREFGAERLLFGSFLPVNDPLVPMGLVLDADLSDQDKATIAGGALRRLVAEVRV